MEELSIEQKAKRYDEAIKRLEDIMTGKSQKTFMFTQGLFDYIFPELKENEEDDDEKVINNIKKVIGWYRGMFTEKSLMPEEYQEIDAWLEKQGEHKPTAEEVLIKAGLKPYKDGNQWCILVGDNIQEGICGFGDTIEDALYNFLKEICKTRQKPTKVEPKYAEIVRTNFKDGDWVVYQNETFQVRSLSNGSRLLQGEKYQTYFIDELCRPWTIRDAKDGDVLATEDWVFIFEKMNSNEKPVCHCHYDIELGFILDANSYIATGSEIYPATKEQRDLLFQKMKEAGYEWDAEKKELKKIEPNPAMIQWKGDNLKEVVAFTGVYKEGFEKWFHNSWEEYEKYVHEHNNIFKIFNEDGSHMEVPVGAWIIKAPDGYNTASRFAISPILTEISIESNFKFKKAIECIENYVNSFPHSQRPEIWQHINFLKSFKGIVQPQSTWKPSEEQMTALRRMKAAIAGEGEIYTPLNSLYNDLKKLREE